MKQSSLHRAVASLREQLAAPKKSYQSGIIYLPREAFVIADRKATRSTGSFDQEAYSTFIFQAALETFAVEDRPNILADMKRTGRGFLIIPTRGSA